MEINVGSRVADVSLVSKEGNRVKLLVDGKEYDLNIVTAENGRCSILHNGNSISVDVTKDDSGKNYNVDLFYRSYQVEIVDEEIRYLRMRKGGRENQDEKVVAPMAGKIFKIMVEEGQRLQSGDILFVLEAMKMQSNYKVASDCVVREILVKEGDAVNANQELILLDIINE